MSANALKIIALVSMTIDHMGLMLFPDQSWMRIVGRVAFPIFAFMIAEGCEHTHNRSKYLSQIAIMGVGMQIVLFIATGSLYQSVFISFALAIILIYAIDKAREEKQLKYWLSVILLALAVLFLCLCLPKILHNTDYDIDYNIVGVCIPVLCYFSRSKKEKVLLFTLGLVALSVYYGGIQWFCLLSVPLIAMYNYQKGRFTIKKLFYIYYPAHLLVLFAIETIINS